MDEYETEAREAEEWRKREDVKTNSTTNFSEEDRGQLEGTWYDIFGTPGGQQRRYWTSQRYATYPPTIPGENLVVGFPGFISNELMQNRTHMNLVSRMSLHIHFIVRLLLTSFFRTD